MLTRCRVGFVGDGPNDTNGDFDLGVLTGKLLTGIPFVVGKLGNCRVVGIDQDFQYNDDIPESEVRITSNVMPRVTLLVVSAGSSIAGGAAQPAESKPINEGGGTPFGLKWK